MTENLPEPYHPPGWVQWLIDGDIPGATKAIARLVGAGAESIASILLVVKP